MADSAPDRNGGGRQEGEGLHEGEGRQERKGRQQGGLPQEVEAPEGAGARQDERALHVGLTGNVASGKSTVARVWEGMGVPVVSADQLARDAVAPGSEGLAQVVDAFGEAVLAADGSLDRGALRKKVFADGRARRRLEAILHPRIAALREAWVRAREAEGAPILVSEVPLLFEAGLVDAFDCIVVVHAPEEERRRRLVEDRGLPAEEARRIMASQGDPEEKRARAHHVLLNDGTVEELEEGARSLMARLAEEAPSGDTLGGPATPRPDTRGEEAPGLATPSPDTPGEDAG